MNNKYQEALDYITSQNIAVVCSDVAANEIMEKMNLAFNTLQELIDNNLKLEKALDKACSFLEYGYGNSQVENYGGWYGVRNKENWKEWLLKDEQ